MNTKYRVSKENNEWIVSNRAGLILAYFEHKIDAEDYAAAQSRADEQSQVLRAWEAWEQAEEEFASTPHEVADWLLDAVAEHVGPDDVIDTLRIHERDIQGAPVRILLALIMTGTDQQANLARFFLRSRFAADHKREIQARADQLLIEAAQREERDFDVPSWLLPSDAH